MCLVGGFGVWAMVAFGNAARNPPVLHMALPELAFTDFKNSVQLEVNASLGLHNKLGWPFTATIESIQLDVYSLDIQQKSKNEIKFGSDRLEPKLGELIKVHTQSNANHTFHTSSKGASIGDEDMSALKARIDRDCHTGAKVTKVKVTVNPRFDMRFGIKRGQEDELVQDFVFDVWCEGTPVDSEGGVPARAQLERSPGTDAELRPLAALHGDAPVLV
jgi:hypothetical protein